MYTILLVEDDQLLREMYLECLSSEKVKVTPAQDGQEAIDKLQQQAWDLILLDMMLPKINGYEIIQKISENPRTYKYKKLVLMTNVEPDTQFKEVLKKADGYLIKSEYNPDDFVQKITEFLGNNS